VTQITVEKEADRFTLTATGPVALGAPPTAPADGKLIHSSISFWIDEAGNKLKVTVKYSDGRIKTAAVPLR